MKGEMSLTAILAFVPVISGPNMTVTSIPNYLILDENLMLIAGCFLSSFFSPQAWAKFEADSIYIIGTSARDIAKLPKTMKTKFFCVLPEKQENLSNWLDISSVWEAEKHRKRTPPYSILAHFGTVETCTPVSPCAKAWELTSKLSVKRKMGNKGAEGTGAWFSNFVRLKVQDSLFLEKHAGPSTTVLGDL